MVKKIAGDFARATVIALHPESHDDTIFKAAVEKLKKEFNDVDISLEKEKTEETGYYRRLRFHVYASPPRGHEIEARATLHPSS